MMRVNRPATILVLISITASSCSTGSDAPPAAKPPATQGTPAAAAQAEANRTTPLTVDEVVVRAKQISDTIPRARYDLGAASDALGAGVEPAFQFVRDRIGFESYSGVLRGAAGTLASRAGNALDRALLLADILTRKGIRTRFVVGQLDASGAERLMVRLFGDANSGGGTGAFAPSPAAFVYDPLLSRVYTRAARDYTAIRAALGASMPKSASVPPRGWWAIAGPRADTRAVLENGAGGIIGDFDPGGGWAGTGPGGGGAWDAGTGQRTGGRYGTRRQPQKKGGGNEYLMVIASVTVAVVLSVYLMVAFYREVLVPTMAGQVQDAVQTGWLADQQR